jgi:hypothetical protein
MGLRKLSAGLTVCEKQLVEKKMRVREMGK